MKLTPSILLHNVPNATPGHNIIDKITIRIKEIILGSNKTVQDFAKNVNGTVTLSRFAIKRREKMK